MQAERQQDPGLHTLPLSLPASFRRRDFEAFHARDAEQVAERCDAAGLDKGFVHDRRAALLRVRREGSQALAELNFDGGAQPADGASLSRTCVRVLALQHDIDAFEAAFASHATLGPLIRRLAGLRIPLAATPFEALLWAIAGQQISVAAAVSLRRRLILAGGVRHSSGIACFPDAAAVLRSILVGRQ